MRVSCDEEERLRGAAHIILVMHIDTSNDVLLQPDAQIFMSD